MFGSLGFPEILLILVLALLVFGPKRLPEVGRTIGKGLSEFRRASADLKRTVNAELALDEDEHTRAPRRPEAARALPGAGAAAGAAGAASKAPEVRAAEGTAPRAGTSAPDSPPVAQPAARPTAEGDDSASAAAEGSIAADGSRAIEESPAAEESPVADTEPVTTH